jgi:membrane protease YdiL (CAAX protease family)
MPLTARERRSALGEAAWASVFVTAGATLATWALPRSWHTTVVGFVFLGATWVLVWRGDDERVRRAGLALGGLVIPGPLDGAAIARATARAVAWALAALAVVAVPYFLGWRAWERPALPFSLDLRPRELGSEALGQVFVIALPEEAFYRGYLQSRLDEVWPPARRIAGAAVGPGLLVASAIFAVGHLATVREPARLAVFFPALLFGWIRARTGGIGASVLLHAGCNVYSQILGRGYGVY